MLSINIYKQSKQKVYIFVLIVLLLFNKNLPVDVFHSISSK